MPVKPGRMPVGNAFNSARTNRFNIKARGHRLTELIIPDADKEESAAILAAVLNGQTILKEVVRRQKDSHLVPVEINTSPIRGRSGRVIGTSVIYRDIANAGAPKKPDAHSPTAKRGSASPSRTRQ